MKREDERAEMIRSMLWLHEKAMLVGEIDAGDADGWGDRRYRYGVRLKVMCDDVVSRVYHLTI